MAGRNLLAPQAPVGRNLLATQPQTPAPDIQPEATHKPYSGMLLPFSTDESGEVSFDSNAGIVGAVKRAWTTPGDVLTGKLDMQSEEGSKRMLEAAMLASPMGAASRVSGSVFAPKSAYKAVKSEGPSVKDLKGQAGKIYDEVETSGIEIRPEAFSGMVQGLEMRLQSAGFHPKMHPKAAGALEAISDFAGKAALTMQDMGIVRRLAKSAKNSIDPDEARIGREILKHIDDNMRQLPGVSEKLSKADKLWSMAKKTELIDKAVGAAKETASGFENGLRIEFRKLLKKAREGKLQLSPQEEAAMRKVVEGSVPANVLKGIGKLGPAPGGAGNALLAVLAGSGGYALGGPAGMAGVMGTGYGARLGAQALTKSAAGKARGVVSGAKPQQVYAPSATQETMLKALMSRGLNGQNSKMRNALGAR